ncbi:oxidoreductase [Pseudoclavibacter endophyticus]|uniref:Propionate 3-nitronate monooxygenase n=1 Tax=Pseudoclavibacter endophyticus TaxID=1778590 RepID=A0A6H9WU23_9MICO|nr:nitronate monooxygenase [Pseudoclavibacter endophyticus]KAB1649954.1 2-nitropropane dioxygenase [Pseudoclavibacter endophyticus]GGA58435.1 oxidoreductase [Pseudoclavibacter endophyticus]
MIDLRSLPIPVIGAPMAGGPSAPTLAAAVTLAGGLGMLAGGSIRADALAASVRAARDLLATAGAHDAPIGVNLFVPRIANVAERQIADLAAHVAAIDRYATHLAASALAARLGVGRADLGAFSTDDDEDWDAKLAFLETEPVQVVTFTFGLPDLAVFERLHAVGSAVGVMVTSRSDALAAAYAGADVVIAQGVRAGGHRSTWRVQEQPNADDTLVVVRSIAEVRHGPGHPRPVIVAAGGIDGPQRYSAARVAGADLVQVGTALLRADEAGTKPTVLRALTDSGLGETVTTRAFSGRFARAIRNEFTDCVGALAPAAYPEVNQLTGPLRAAAEAAGDVHGVSAYAGERWRAARAAPAAEILRELVGR